MFKTSGGNKVVITPLSISTKYLNGDTNHVSAVYVDTWQVESYTIDIHKTVCELLCARGVFNSLVSALTIEGKYATNFSGYLELSSIYNLFSAVLDIGKFVDVYFDLSLEHINKCVVDVMHVKAYTYSQQMYIIRCFLLSLESWMDYLNKTYGVGLKYITDDKSSLPVSPGLDLYSYDNLFLCVEEKPKF